MVQLQGRLIEEAEFWRSSSDGFSVALWVWFPAKERWYCLSVEGERFLICHVYICCLLVYVGSLYAFFSARFHDLQLLMDVLFAWRCTMPEKLIWLTYAFPWLSFWPEAPPFSLHMGWRCCILFHPLFLLQSFHNVDPPPGHVFLESDSK